MMDIQREFENFEACMEGHETALHIFEAGAKAALEYARGQPVQPAGTQGDAVHFRAVLCSEQQNQAVGVVPKVVGFVDRKAAEQFILEQRDFKGWKYNLESLYTTPPAQPVQPAVNEQMLEALKVAQGVLFEAGYDIDDGGEHFSEYVQITEAIAAAEAAKGGV